MPTDAKPNIRGGKPLPKWALPVGAVVVVAGVLYWRKHQAAAKSSESSTVESNQEQLNRQSFIPVTGENVAGVGASGGGAGGSGETNNQLLGELLKTQREENSERERNQREWITTLTSQLGTGGGAPTSTAPQGTVAAPPQNGATPPPTPSPAPPVATAPPAPSPPKPAGCPPSFPYSGPHGCYKSITCGNGCAGHRYQNGVAECQNRNRAGHCEW